jgi:hypothetical protein
VKIKGQSITKRDYCLLRLSREVFRRSGPQDRALALSVGTSGVIARRIVNCEETSY